MKKPTQKERILSDLLQGLHVNMLNDISPSSFLKQYHSEREVA